MKTCYLYFSLSKEKKDPLMILLCLLQSYMCSSLKHLTTGLQDTIDQGRGFIIEYPTVFHGVTIVYEHDCIMLMYGTYRDIKSVDKCNEKALQIQYSDLQSVRVFIDTVEDFITANILDPNIRSVNIQFKLDVDPVHPNNELLKLFNSISELHGSCATLKERLSFNLALNGFKINVIGHLSRYDYLEPFGQTGILHRDKQYPYKLTSFIELPRRNGCTRLYFFELPINNIISKDQLIEIFELHCNEFASNEEYFLNLALTRLNLFNVIRTYDIEPRVPFLEELNQKKDIDLQLLENEDISPVPTQSKWITTGELFNLIKKCYEERDLIKKLNIFYNVILQSEIFYNTLVLVLSNPETDECRRLIRILKNLRILNDEEMEQLQNHTAGSSDTIALISNYLIHYNDLIYCEPDYQHLIIMIYLLLSKQDLKAFDTEKIMNSLYYFYKDSFQKINLVENMIERMMRLTLENGYKYLNLNLTSNGNSIDLDDLLDHKGTQVTVF